MSPQLRWNRRRARAQQAQGRVFGTYRVTLVKDRGPRKGRLYALALVPKAGDVGDERPPTETVDNSGTSGDGT